MASSVAVESPVAESTPSRYEVEAQALDRDGPGRLPGPQRPLPPGDGPQAPGQDDRDKIIKRQQKA